MRSTQTLSVLIFGLCLIGCTADPYAPVNQTYPIRQMDRFFESLSSPPTPREYPPQGYTPQGYTPQAYPPREHTTQPGYAPAYPVY